LNNSLPRHILIYKDVLLKRVSILSI